MDRNVTLTEARDTINHLVQGIDPYTGEVLESVAFLENPRMIRCFALMSELLTRVIEKPKGQLKANRAKFQISETLAATIKYPPGDVGIKAVLAAVNKAVDTENVSALTVVSLYKVLKEKGILDKSPGEGRTRTVTTAQSKKYGIKTEKNTFQGEEYDRIIYTDEAKEYLRKSLPIWFPPKES